MCEPKRVFQNRTVSRFGRSHLIVLLASAGFILVSLNGGVGSASPLDEVLIKACVDDTGYAFAGGSSPVSLDGQSIYIFGNEFDRPIDCFPFHTDQVAVGSGSNLGSVYYFVGIGVNATSIGSHTPASTGGCARKHWLGIDTEIPRRSKRSPSHWPDPD